MNVTLDCSQIQAQEELFQLFSQTLPGLYGHNLDALHDCLTTLNGTLRLEHWAEAAAALGPYGQRATKMLLTAALENEALELSL